MNYPETDPELCTLMDCILRDQFTDFSALHRNCLSLRRKATQRHSAFALAFAEVYLADYQLAASADVHTITRQLSRAQKLAEPLDHSPLLIVLYNLYGVMLTSQGEHSLAVDYFVQALARAEQLQDYNALAMLYSNIANVFLELRQYEMALPYCKRALSACHRLPPNHRRRQGVHIAQLNLVEIQLHTGHPEQALPALSKFEKAATPAAACSLSLAARSCRCLALHQLGRDAEATECIDGILADHRVDYDGAAMFFFSMYKVCDTALELCDRARADALIEIMEHSPLLASSRMYQAEILQFRIRYGEQFGADDSTQLALYRQLNALHLAARADDDQEHAHAVKAKIDVLRVYEENRLIHQENLQLQRLSGVDELTGLANRRMLDEQLSNLLRTARQTKTMLGVIMIDLDKFKSYNDSYGHSIGDALLCAAAQSLLQDDIRFFAARFGGDEFMVLCENCSDRELRKFVLRAQSAFGSAQAGLLPPGIQATLSAGYYNCVPSSSSSTSEFFELADRALYRAKNERGICINFMEA